MSVNDDHHRIRVYLDTEKAINANRSTDNLRIHSYLGYLL
jgi:hypothetical protein